MDENLWLIICNFFFHTKLSSMRMFKVLLNIGFDQHKIIIFLNARFHITQTCSLGVKFQG